MKKYLCVLFVFLCCNYCLHAQLPSYNDAKHTLDSLLKTYLQDNKAVQLAKKWKQEFENAKKINPVHFPKMNIGVSVFLPYHSKDADVYPAKFLYNQNKVGIQAVRSLYTEAPTEEMRAFTDKYLNNFEEIFVDKEFRALVRNNRMEADEKMSATSNELILQSQYSNTFLRAASDWMYAISYGTDGFLIFAFKQKYDGKDVITDDLVKRINDERDAEIKNLVKNYPFEHSSDDGNFANYIKRMREQLSEFKSDAVFMKNTKADLYEMKRDNLKDYTALFEFLLSYKFPKDYLEDNDPNRDTYGVKHFAAHTLGDMYFGEKKYAKAIECYKLAAMKYTDRSTSPDNEGSHVDDILEQISESYQKLNKKNEAHAFYLASVLDDDEVDDDENLVEMMEQKGMTKMELKKAVDKAYASLVEFKPDYCKMNLMGVEVFVYVHPGYSKSTIKERLMISEFYKSLQ